MVNGRNQSAAPTRVGYPAAEECCEWTSRHRARVTRWMSRASALFAVCLALAFLPSPASASFPGADGRIAFMTTPGTKVWTVQPDGSDLRQIGPPDALTPSWSPDGQSIAFARSVRVGGALGDVIDVMVMSAEGGDQRVLARVNGPNFTGTAPTFSPSGRRIVYSTGSAIKTIGINGGDPQVLVRNGRHPNGGVVGVSTPEFSPSGKRIAFTGLPKGEDFDGLWTMRRNGTDLRFVVGGIEGSGGLSWSPEGRWLAFNGRDASLVHPNGRARRLFAVGFRGPAWSPSGTQIAAVGVESHLDHCADLYTMSPTGTARTQITNFCAQTVDGDPIEVPREPSWQPLPG